MLCCIFIGYLSIRLFTVCLNVPVWYRNTDYFDVHNYRPLFGMWSYSIYWKRYYKSWTHSVSIFLLVFYSEEATVSFDQYLISLMSPAVAAQTEIKLTPLNSWCLFFGNFIISLIIFFFSDILYDWFIRCISYTYKLIRLHYLNSGQRGTVEIEPHAVTACFLWFGLPDIVARLPDWTRCFA